MKKKTRKNPEEKEVDTFGMRSVHPAMMYHFNLISFFVCFVFSLAPWIVHAIHRNNIVI